MIEPSTGLNKGYGFVTFCDKESAKKAVEKVKIFYFKRAI